MKSLDKNKSQKHMKSPTYIQEVTTYLSDAITAGHIYVK